MPTFLIRGEDENLAYSGTFFVGIAVVVVARQESYTFVSGARYVYKLI